MYKKINLDPNFRAESQDVVGHWDCVDIQHDAIYDVFVTQDQVTIDLQSRGYLYNNTTRHLTGGYPDGSWIGYFAWGCSVPEFEYYAPLYEWVVGRIEGPIDRKSVV